MGNVAATDALLSWIPEFPGGRGELLVISVSANHGNSGGPVISLETGQVIGMIIQYVPAPMPLKDSNGQTITQQSGLMVAVPAQWISDLLQRHGVSTTPIMFKEHMVLNNAAK